MGTPHISSKGSAGSTVAVLVDGVNDCYADWRHDASAVREAYISWCNSPLARQVESYLAYMAALDQEESAAANYALAVAALKRQGAA